MLIQNRLHCLLIEVASLTRSLVCERVIEHLAQIAIEPAVDRNIEAMLGPMNDFFGNQSGDCSLQNVLGLKPVQLERSGNGLDKLDQLVVEQGSARLQR